MHEARTLQWRGGDVGSGERVCVSRVCGPWLSRRKVLADPSGWTGLLGAGPGEQGRMEAGFPWAPSKARSRPAACLGGVTASLA